MVRALSIASVVAGLFLVIARAASCADPPRVHTLPGHYAAIHALCFSPDGKYLASGGGTVVYKTPKQNVSVDGFFRIWDVEHGTLSMIDPWTQRQDLGLSLAWGDQVKKVEHGWPPIVCFMYTPSGQQLIRGHVGLESEWLGTPSYRFANFHYLDRRFSASLIPAPGPLQVVAFSRDGKLFAAGCKDTSGRFRYQQFVALIDPATGKVRASVTVYDLRIGGILLSRDGKFMVTTGLDSGPRGPVFRIKAWDLETGQQRSQINGEASLALTPGDVDLSPDGETIVTRGPAPYMLWDSRTGQPKRPIRDGDRKTTDLRRKVDGPLRFLMFPDRQIAFSPDGKTLAINGQTGRAGDKTHTLRLWDVATGKVVATPDPARVVTNMAFSFDGSKLAYSYPLAPQDPAIRQSFAWVEGTNHDLRHQIGILDLKAYLRSTSDEVTRSPGETLNRVPATKRAGAEKR